MLKNYIKIAFKVMLRQKFFTAVSIFGISFTIMVFSITAGMSKLMLGDTEYAPNRTKTFFYDGYDLRDKNDRSINKSVINTSALIADIKKLHEVERLSEYTSGMITSYTNNKKISLTASFTDEELWSIYNFRFIEGRSYNKKEVSEGQSLAVITEAVKKFYFGDKPAVGQYLPTTPKLKVIGVIKDFLNIEEYGVEAATVFIPLLRYDHTKANTMNYSAVILTKEGSDMHSLWAKIESLITTKYNPTKGSVHLNGIGGMPGQQMFLPYIAAFILFMMLIPALNLVGLNINRIIERSSEIGIRKSFGASSLVLVGQFLTENIIVAFFGGLLGILITIPMSDVIVGLMYSTETIVPSENFLVDWTIIIYAIMASVFFGILSGVLPAWKMSKLQTVSALKGGKS